jgi:hypothetical protein
LKVIETNIFYNNDIVADHQSRLIEVDSWDEYISLYNNYNGEPTGEYKGNLMGYTLPKNAHIDSLTYDKFHLRCNLILWNNQLALKTAYLI